MKSKVQSALKLFSLIFISIFGLFASYQLVNAASVDDIITSVSLTNQSGAPLTNGLNTWEKFQMDAKFAFDYGKVQPGDQTTIEVPSQINLEGADFEIKDPEGNVVATAVLDGGKKVVLTYTDYVLQRAHISGNIHLVARVDHTVVRDQSTIPLTLKLNNQIIDVGKIDFNGVPIGKKPDAYTFVKYGWDNADDIKSITYSLEINQDGKDLQNVAISDSLKFQEGQIDENSFEIVKGTWGVRASDNSYQLENQSGNLATNYAIDLSADKRSFKINLGNIAASEGYYVRYRVKFDTAPSNFSVFPNQATLNADNMSTIESAVNVHYQRATGDAIGDVYEVQVHKKDTDGKSLKGAEFTIYDGTTEVAKATSDENGIASFKNLVKDQYTIKETKAPEGYRLSDEELTVLASERVITVGGVTQYSPVISKEFVNVQISVQPPTKPSTPSSSDTNTPSTPSSNTTVTPGGSGATNASGASSVLTITNGSGSTNDVAAGSSERKILPKTGQVPTVVMSILGILLLSGATFFVLRLQKQH